MNRFSGAVHLREAPSNPDLWRVPAFLLWLLLFLGGLAPDRVFLLLREWGHVKTQSALINSHYLITLALAGFYGYFTYQRCIDAGCSELLARGKALQATVIGLVAFLAVPWSLLRVLSELPRLELRLVVVLACSLKAGAWIYLMTVLVRYYFWSGQAVYHGMPSLLPSTHVETDATGGLRSQRNADLVQPRDEHAAHNICGELRAGPVESSDDDGAC